MRQWPWLIAAVAAVGVPAGGAGHALAQSPATSVGSAHGTAVVDSALASLLGWSARVRAGTGDAAWLAASPWFQTRISLSQWGGWTRAHRPQWKGVGPARVVRFGFGRDEAPPPTEWVEAVLVSDRAAGGTIVERLWAQRQEGTPWRITDYAVWADGQAIVTNAFFAPVPLLSFQVSHRFLHARRLPPTAAAPGPGPPPPRAIANPRTFPRRP